MPLEVDASQRFATDARRRALVEAVLAGDDEDEAGWIEWKSTLDLSTNEHKAKVAKSILAFANRMPERDEEWADGHGYLLVGVAPDNLAGTDRMDIAKVEAKIQPWVGTGRRAPRWNAAWVAVGDKDVLVIEVGPPEPGDPLFPLRTKAGNSAEGTVFVRRLASSDPASAEEILQLSERAAGRRRMHIEVHAASAQPLPAVMPTDAVLDITLEWLRDAARAPLLKGRAKREGERARRRREAMDRNPMLPSALADLVVNLPQGLTASTFNRALGGEGRTEDDYEDEVDEYIDECRSTLPLVIIARCIEAELAALSLTLTNDTEHHLAAVQVRASVAGPIHVWTAERRSTLPNPPRPFGTGIDVPDMRTWLSPDLDLAAIGPTGPTAAQFDDRIEIRWPPVDVPPLDSVTLPEVEVAVSEVPPEGAVTVEWRASAPDALGVASGEFSIAVKRFSPSSEQILSLVVPD